MKMNSFVFLLNLVHLRNAVSAIIIVCTVYTVPPSCFSVKQNCQKKPYSKLFSFSNVGSTGCLNLLCPTYFKPTFFRMKWHSKQKPFIFGILGRGDLCMDNQFLGCFPYPASTASYLKDAIFLMIQWRKTCVIFQAKMISLQLEWHIPWP